MGSPVTFLHPAPALILSNTLLLLPQKVWTGCVETHRARQGQDWRILCVQAGGQSWRICHLGSGELSRKSTSCKPHRQIHVFFLSLLVSFLLTPPLWSCCLLVLLQCILIHYSSPAGLSVLSLQLASVNLFESGSTVAKKYSNILFVNDHCFGLHLF